MIKRIRTFVALAVVMVGFAACSSEMPEAELPEKPAQEQQNNTPQPEKVKMTLKASFENISGSRVELNGLKPRFEIGDKIGVYCIVGEYGTEGTYAQPFIVTDIVDGVATIEGESVPSYDGNYFMVYPYANGSYYDYKTDAIKNLELRQADREGEYPKSAIHYGKYVINQTGDVVFKNLCAILKVVPSYGLYESKFGLPLIWSLDARVGPVNINSIRSDVPHLESLDIPTFQIDASELTDNLYIPVAPGKIYILDDFYNLKTNAPDLQRNKIYTISY